MPGNSGGDLFGMVKCPFQRLKWLSDLQQGGSKGHGLNHLLVIFLLNQKTTTKHVKYSGPSVANLSRSEFEGFLAPCFAWKKASVFGELNQPVKMEIQLDFHKNIKRSSAGTHVFTK